MIICQDKIPCMRALNSQYIIQKFAQYHWVAMDKFNATHFKPFCQICIEINLPIMMSTFIDFKLYDMLWDMAIA